jgi:hypothetical protein
MSSVPGTKEIQLKLVVCPICERQAWVLKTLSPVVCSRCRSRCVDIGTRRAKVDAKIYQESLISTPGGVAI